MRYPLMAVIALAAVSAAGAAWAQTEPIMVTQQATQQGVLQGTQPGPEPAPQAGPQPGVLGLPMLGLRMLRLPRLYLGEPMSPSAVSPGLLGGPSRLIPQPGVRGLLGEEAGAAGATASPVAWQQPFMMAALAMGSNATDLAYALQAQAAYASAPTTSPVGAAAGGGVAAAPPGTQPALLGYGVIGPSYIGMAGVAAAVAGPGASQGDTGIIRLPILSLPVLGPPTSSPGR